MTDDIQDIDVVRKALDKILKDEKKYCEYSECLVRYFEHWHIDRYTLTFRKPETEFSNG